MSDTKTEHTPGPWTVQLPRHGPDEPIWILGPEPKTIFVARMGSAMGYNDATHETQLADARLIAAAPDLLEALTSLADCPGLTPLPGYRSELDAAMVHARAAIAKATEAG